MKYQKRNIFLVLVLVLVYNIFFIKKQTNKLNVDRKYENIVILRYPSSEKIKNGDMIFRRLYDITSTMACNFSEGEKRYSHVGIIVFYNNKKMVLHILPKEGIVVESIKSFLSESKIWAVYRYQELNSLQVNRIALAYLNKNINFDDNYNLSTKESLYCSEMIADIINESLRKNYILPGKLFAGRKFITISDMYDNNVSILVEKSHQLKKFI